MTELETTAQQLNRERDVLRLLVEDVEKRLKIINAGLRLWCDLKVTGKSLKLGYDKSNGNWGLQISSNTEGMMWLFNDAPFEYRVIATDAIPFLFKAIEEKAKEEVIRAKESSVKLAKFLEDLDKND